MREIYSGVCCRLFIKYAPSWMHTKCQEKQGRKDSRKRRHRSHWTITSIPAASRNSIFPLFLLIIAPLNIATRFVIYLSRGFPPDNAPHCPEYHPMWQSPAVPSGYYLCKQHLLLVEHHFKALALSLLDERFEVRQHMVGALTTAGPNGL